MQTPSAGGPKPPATTEDRFKRYVQRVSDYATKKYSGREIQNIGSKKETKLSPQEKSSTEKTAIDKTKNFSSDVFKMLGNYFLLSTEKKLEPETKRKLSSAAVEVKNSGHTLLSSFIKTVQAGIDKLNSWRFKEETTHRHHHHGSTEETTHHHHRVLDSEYDSDESDGESDWDDWKEELKVESDEEEWKEEAPETREQSKEESGVIKPEPGPVQGAITRGGTVIPEEPGGTGLAELLNIPLNKDESPVQDYDVEEKTVKPAFTSGNIISRRLPSEKEGLGLAGLSGTQEKKGASAEPEKPAKDAPNRPGSIFSRRFPRDPSIVKKAFGQTEKIEKKEENNDKEKEK